MVLAAALAVVCVTAPPSTKLMNIGPIGTDAMRLMIARCKEYSGQSLTM